MNILKEQIIRTKELMGLITEQEEVICDYNSFKDKTRIESKSSVDLFNGLYEAGFTEVGKDYKGCWWREDFTFGDYIMKNNGTGMMPKSPTTANMRLESTKVDVTVWDDWSDEMREYVESYTSLHYNIAGQMYGAPAYQTLFIDSNGNKVEPNTFWDGLQKKDNRKLQGM